MSLTDGRARGVAGAGAGTAGGSAALSLLDFCRTDEVATGEKGVSTYAGWQRWSFLAGILARSLGRGLLLSKVRRLLFVGCDLLILLALEGLCLLELRALVVDKIVQDRETAGHLLLGGSESL